MALVLKTLPSERLLGLIQAQHPGYHPALAIAKLAHDPTVMADPKLELECHKTLLPYLESKLSTVEQKIDLTETRRVIVSLFEPEVEDVEVIEEPLKSLSYDDSDVELIQATQQELDVVNNGS